MRDLAALSLIGGPPRRAAASQRDHVPSIDDDWEPPMPEAMRAQLAAQEERARTTARAVAADLWARHGPATLPPRPAKLDKFPEPDWQDEDDEAEQSAAREVSGRGPKRSRVPLDGDASDSQQETKGGGEVHKRQLNDDLRDVPAVPARVAAAPSEARPSAPAASTDPVARDRPADEGFEALLSRDMRQLRVEELMDLIEYAPVPNLGEVPEALLRGGKPRAVVAPAASPPTPRARESTSALELASSAMDEQVTAGEQLADQSREVDHGKADDEVEEEDDDDQEEAGELSAAIRAAMQSLGMQSGHVTAELLPQQEQPDQLPQSTRGSGAGRGEGVSDSDDSAEGWASDRDPLAGFGSSQLPLDEALAALRAPNSDADHSMLRHQPTTRSGAAVSRLDADVVADATDDVDSYAAAAHSNEALLQEYAAESSSAMTSTESAWHAGPRQPLISDDNEGRTDDDDDDDDDNDDDDNHIEADEVSAAIVKLRELLTARADASRPDDGASGWGRATTAFELAERTRREREAIRQARLADMDLEDSDSDDSRRHE